MRIRGHLPADNLGRSERDDAAEEEEVGAGGCDFAVLGGVGASATTEVCVFGTGATDVSLGLASGSFRLKLQLHSSKILSIKKSECNLRGKRAFFKRFRERRQVGPVLPRDRRWVRLQ